MDCCPDIIRRFYVINSGPLSEDAVLEKVFKKIQKPYAHYKYEVVSSEFPNLTAEKVSEVLNFVGMKFIGEDKKEEFATLESIVTDQGNGSSYCSACKASVDIFRLASPMRCPNCNVRLEWGKMYINEGGSDF